MATNSRLVSGPLTSRLAPHIQPRTQQTPPAIGVLADRSLGRGVTVAKALSKSDQAVYLLFV